MRDRTAQKATVASDLGERRSLGWWRVEPQSVAAGVGGVEYSESIPCGIGVEHGPWRAVDQYDVAEHAVHVGAGDLTAVGERVLERSVRGKRSIGDHQRDVAITLRQRQGQLFIVVHEVKSREPTPDGLAGVAHSVVVIPQRRRALLHGVDVYALPDNGIA